MAAKKVSIKNYEKAEYKTQLTAYEYNDLVSSAVSGIIDLYDKGIYGFNSFTVNSSLVSVCTNIKMGINDPDVKLWLFEETDVLSRIIQSIGESIYNRIMNEIDLGLRYRISTNPETKQLLIELAKLTRNLSEVSKNVTDDMLNSLLSSVKNVIPMVQEDENK